MVFISNTNVFVLKSWSHSRYRLIKINCIEIVTILKKSRDRVAVSDFNSEFIQPHVEMALNYGATELDLRFKTTNIKHTHNAFMVPVSLLYLDPVLGFMILWAIDYKIFETKVLSPNHKWWQLYD